MKVGWRGSLGSNKTRGAIKVDFGARRKARGEWQEERRRDGGDI
jgi:hypothetical protein